jgi:hypothetical protein
MKPIPNYPGYFADEKGNIYSMKQLRNSKQQPKFPRLLKPHIKRSNGRKSIELCNDGKHFWINIAHLVLITFISPRPTGMSACHGIRGCQDDSIDNIYWATQKQNMADKYRDGTQQCGERHNLHKLNELQVRIAIRFYELNDKRKTTRKYLANIFGCTVCTIGDIYGNRSWKYLPRHI